MGGQGATGTGLPPLIGPPAFVARERELAALAAALESGPAVVMVAGEAGVGKSRLVQEAISPDRCGQRVLVADCPPLRAPHTLGPVVDALRGATERVGGLRLSPLAGVLRPLFPEWVPELPPPPEALDDAGAARHRLFRAVAELLHALHVDVLVVEDVHWADETTLEFLLFLVSGRPRVGLVVTYRPEDLPEDSLLLRLSSAPAPGMALLGLDVAPLDVTGTADLVSSMLGGEQVSVGFAGFLHERTAGVPMVLEESVRLMGDRADLVRCESGWVRRALAEIVVPPTVRDAVLERFRRLPPDARTLLAAAAVLAEPAGEPVLAAVSGLRPGALVPGLTGALGSGLLRENGRGRFAFHHALAARAVYDAVPLPERRAAHLRAARALETAAAPPAARLAHHYQEAGRTAEWCRYAERAADLALATADEAAAADVLHDLLTTADLPARDVARLMARVRPGPVTGSSRCADLVGALRAVLAREVLPPETEGELRFHLGRLLNLLGEYTEGRTQLEAAVEHLSHSPELAARAMHTLSRPREPTLPGSDHLEWLRRAGELTAALSPAGRAAFAVGRVEVLLEFGEEAGWALAAELPDSSPDGHAAETILRAHINIGSVAIRWGRHEEAERRVALAVEVIDPDQYPHLPDLIEVSRIYLDWYSGRWEGLAGRIADLAARVTPTSSWTSDVDFVAGMLQIATGDEAAGAELVRKALDTTRRSGALEYLPLPAGTLARLHLAAGQVEEALAVTDEPVKALARKGIWMWAAEVVPVRVEALLAAGRDGEAADLVDAFVRGLGDRDIPAARAALATSRAVLAAHGDDPAAAAEGFAGAAGAWEGLPRPYDTLLARERQAACLLAADRANDAGRALLREVHAGLIDLGATADAARVARTLRGLGIDVRLRQWSGWRGYGDALSPRELEVVGMVAAGMTNRAIGEALTLSPKTIARHVDGAMRKLGVSSRTALAVSAVEAGIVNEAGPRPVG